MAEEDQVVGADFLQLDPSTAPLRGLSTWLTGALRTAIADGRLPVGARLPATRNLAVELGVSRGVVVEAYQRVVDEGILAGPRGGGTAVRAAAPPHRPVQSSTVAPTSVELDLSSGLPDLSAFPRAAWLRAERTVLAGLGAADLGYGDPRGMPALREALAGWLARTRSIRADPQDLLVANGVAQGLALLAQVLRARETRAVGFENLPRRAPANSSNGGACARSRCRWTTSASTSMRWRPPGWTPSWSPRHTNSRPVWCWPRPAAALCSTGPAEQA
ncbi:MAG: aminotransferase class I/II-fold pyridoxal phosphate-dependent enzyme [Pseudonocardiaceae bacterium]